jgi:radical SAM superfamily enzyme YgiQ (UPF0313 family)
MILEPDLRRTLLCFQPDVVGTSAYITGVNAVKSVCREAKSLRPGTLTVVGGVHATLAPEDFNDSSIDVVVMGDGIPIMKSIVDHRERKESLAGIAGCAFPSSIGLRRPLSANLRVEPAGMPLPRRDLVDRYRHRYYYLFHQPVALIKTTFGCPFRCRFCCCWKLTDGTVTFRTPASIVEEIATIPCRDVYIVDDTFFLDVDRLRAIRDLLLQRGVRKRYLIYSRADFIVRHPEIVAEWAGIGLVACIIGLESPRARDLHEYDKRVSVEQNTRAIRIMRDNRVDTYGSFIVPPDWDREDFAALQRTIDDTGLYYVIIQPLTPLPGTETFQQYSSQLTRARELPEIWDLQHVLLPSRLSPKAFYREIRRIYTRTIVNPGRARRLDLRTAPPVWSLRYMRLLAGGVRVMLALRTAHRHAERLERANRGRPNAWSARTPVDAQGP